VTTSPPAATRPKAVLFDLDGTLVDTVERRIAGWQEAFAQRGITVTKDELAPLIGIDGRRLAREVTEGAGRSPTDEEIETLDRIAGERFAALNQVAVALAGFPELVDALDLRGIVWAIATSSRREQVAASVAALGLAEEPRIVDASHVTHAKPAPDLLLLAARQLGIEPAGCWYVGDSTWDMLAAVAAGMVAVGVTAGAAVDAATLEAAGAHLVVPGLADLVPHIATFDDATTAGAGR
jgi:HAD superfamily hydrolase (TIGR01509 family)